MGHNTHILMLHVGNKLNGNYSTSLLKASSQQEVLLLVPEFTSEDEAREFEESFSTKSDKAIAIAKQRLGTNSG